LEAEESGSFVTSKAILMPADVLLTFERTMNLQAAQ